ncbi:MAG: conserved membrane protein of unknown function [Candidatus Thorarchaeota archaeon]|nr:MAG: conserved membrane protein of unknown function [Candidatus Thorarchaeota archaeon]
MTEKGKSQAAENVKPLRDLFHFDHFSEFYKLYVPISILVGLVCGLAMVAFQLFIDGMIFLFSGIPLFIAPLIGGLFSGVLIYFGVREIEGSGISKAIELTHDIGELHPRTAITKIIATSVSIGSGNPVGREGPAVLIGAAIANTIGKKMGYCDVPTLRVFTMMGSAACTAGIYKAPLGGALFASEAPYKRDARMGYFVPTILAAITSYLVFTIIMGIQPLLPIENGFVLTFEVVPLIIAMGVVCGAVAILFSVSLMATRNFFKIKLPNWADPIVGALFACGVIFVTGLFLDPHLTVAGMGYDVIGFISTTTIPISALLVLLFGKLFTTSFVVAGRVSGGVLASSLFVGAMLGAIFGEIFFPHQVIAFMIMGMGGLLAANTNTPIATTILILEISHSFDLLIPLAICICVSYLVGGGTSLYEGQKVARSDEAPNYYAPITSPPYPDLGKSIETSNPADCDSKKSEISSQEEKSNPFRE